MTAREHRLKKSGGAAEPGPNGRPAEVDLTPLEPRQLEVAVIGCGYWGSKHVRVLSELEGVRVTAVDPDPARRAPLQRSFAGLRSAADLEAVIADVDAVVVATPPTCHADLARLALDHGCHVLVEKPMTTTAADAVELVEMAEIRDLVLMAGHTFEFNPAVLALRDLIVQGELGDLLYMDAARLNLGLFRHDVNVIWDLAPHDVSIANFVLGAQPRSVQAWGASHAHPFIEDMAYLRLTYPDLGVTFQTHVSWLSPAKVRRLTVVGANRMAVYNDLNDDERLRIFDKGVVMPKVDALHQVPATYRHGNIVSPYIDFDEPLKLQDRHFLECIRTGQLSRTNGRVGLAVVAALEAAVTSLHDGGREVEVAEIIDAPAPALRHA